MQDIMEDEYSAILSDSGSVDSDDFVTHDEDVPTEYSHIIERVIAVDKLTEITAMVGFSRLTSNYGIDDPNLAPIAKIKKEWLPGIEQKGEGIFIKFNQDILDKWAKKYEKYYLKMGQHLRDSLFTNERFSPQYVFLRKIQGLSKNIGEEEC